MKHNLLEPSLAFERLEECSRIFEDGRENLIGMLVLFSVKNSLEGTSLYCLAWVVLGGKSESVFEIKSSVFVFIGSREKPIG